MRCAAAPLRRVCEWPRPYSHAYLVIVGVGSVWPHGAALPGPLRADSRRPRRSLAPGMYGPSQRPGSGVQARRVCRQDGRASSRVDALACLTRPCLVWSRVVKGQHRRGAAVQSLLYKPTSGEAGAVQPRRRLPGLHRCHTRARRGEGRVADLPILPGSDRRDHASVHHLIDQTQRSMSTRHPLGGPPTLAWLGEATECTADRRPLFRYPRHSTRPACTLDSQHWCVAHLVDFSCS